MKTNKKSLVLYVITACFLLLSCFYMYDFYKCLSGFIANGFREPLVMLPMILAFFLPVICFLFFFYDVYVRAINPIVKAVYSAFVVVYAVTDLVLIFNNIDLYKSNSALGVYESLPSIGLHFPYDMIIILLVLALWQILNLALWDRKGNRFGEKLNGSKKRGAFELRLSEYLLLCVLAIVVFVFTGSAICATFTAFENAFYDARYIFLLVWVMMIPMANLIALALKLESFLPKKGAKIAVLSAFIGANVIFGLLFLVLELTYPDFLVHIGKPLFLIAFSVSLPIEPGAILGIMALGTAVLTVRLVRAAKSNATA